ncbi:arylacetamide deacetylase-like 2 isoform X1 [Neofelis nebulosa]|uniref:arylacetamide deacetylase-like 2 isoform X1 n=2 Tax=Neofelis nebulosa TaxID=61452 RepID=UPI002729DB3E|nr:arylacetamide deacetylase-like 2 isoform X1 [Neofelis nebulosa]
MGCKTLWFGLTLILFGYYIYTPLPENIEEPWKVGVIDALIKTTSLTATLLENMGLIGYTELFSMLLKLDQTVLISDENITVMDTKFTDIPVCLYLPKKKSESQRRAVIFIHGGAFVMGSCRQMAYDFLNRWTANKLGAVVVGIDYRLAPQYQFPVPLEDVISVVRFFLQDNILAKYGVDPSRICISGDSSGGTLAAKVTQLVQNDPEFKNKIKAQALIYPGLQAVDVLMPSHRQNEHGPILSRDMAIKMGCLHLTKDKALPQAVRENQHMPHGSRHLFKLVNWSTLLPEKYRRNHIYTEPIIGKLNSSYPVLLDSRLSPLLATDSQLEKLPLTYIITCEHDILRDDGLIYVSRLRNAAVNVSHDHIEDGIHGALFFMTTPFYLRVGIRISDKYINWLEENL